MTPKNPKQDARERTLTLVIRTEEVYPQWIQDAHIKGPQHGIVVIGIAEGNYIDKLEKAYQEIEDFDLEDQE